MENGAACWWAGFEPVGPEAPLAPRLDRPDSPVARHPHQRLRVQSKPCGSPAGVEQAPRIVMEVGAQPASELAQPIVVELIDEQRGYG